MHAQVKAAGWGVIERDSFGRPTTMTAWVGPRTVGAAPYRILVPVDGSTASTTAVHVAAHFADGHPGAELHLLNVQVHSGSHSDDNILELEGLRATRVATAELAAMGQPYSLHLAAGVPADAIRAYARSHWIQEIVMGSRGTGNLERMVIGSVAMDVAERVPIPVTLVKTSAQAGRLPASWGDWLVPCDYSLGSLHAILHVKQQLVNRQDKPRVHLLHVANDTVARSDRSGEGVCAEAVSALRAAAIDVEVHLERGDPAARILALTERLGCGHIVMGSRGLGLLGSLFLSSVSNVVARQGVVPVTLVK